MKYFPAKLQSSANNTQSDGGLISNNTDLTYVVTSPTKLE